MKRAARMFVKVIVAIGIGVPCCGGRIGCPCMGSLHPLYRNCDVVADDSLTGAWKVVPLDEHGGEGTPFALSIMAVEETSPKWLQLQPALPPALYKPRNLPTYRVLETDKSSKKKGDNDELKDLVFHLVDVKGKRFVDVTVEHPKLLSAPLHCFARVQKVGQNLKISSLNMEWFIPYLEKNHWALKHEIVPSATGKDAAILVTAKPKALQRFAIKHLDTPDAWKPAARLERLNPSNQKAAGTTSSTKQ